MPLQDWIGLSKTHQIVEIMLLCIYHGSSQLNLIFHLNKWHATIIQVMHSANNKDCLRPGWCRLVIRISAKPSGWSGEMEYKKFEAM